MPKLLKWGLIFLVFSLLFLLAGCRADPENKDTEKEVEKADEKELVVSAAMSIRSPLEEIGRHFEQKAPVSMKFNFAASGVLQNQIEQGAPADVYISAGTYHMEKLQQGEYISEESKLDLLKNELVLITSPENDTVFGFSDLATEEVSRVAIGIPETVPAGAYSRDLFKYLDLWEELESKFVFARSVQQAAVYVETNNVDAGIVFQTDVKDKKVEIRSSAPHGSHQIPLYQAAVVCHTRNRQAAEDFLVYLQKERAGDIFEKHGFEFLP